MATAAELIEYLKTIPPDTEVEVLQEDRDGWITSTRWVSLALGDFSDTVFFADYANDTCVKETSHYFGKKVLFLGED
jgi:hypothetical protein